jgi:hypothetical protein
VFPWIRELAVIVVSQLFYHPAAVRNIIDVRTRVTHGPPIPQPFQTVNTYLTVGAVIFPGALDVLWFNWRDGFAVRVGLKLMEVGI